MTAYFNHYWHIHVMECDNYENPKKFHVIWAVLYHNGVEVCGIKIKGL